MRATQNSAEITTGEMVPDLLDFAIAAMDRHWVSKNIERDKINAEKVIDFTRSQSRMALVQLFENN